MRIRNLLAAACVVAGASTMLPAHAAGGLAGTGAFQSGCSGSLLLTATNSSGNNWVFDATLTCTSSAPQHVVIAGQWNAASGGTVTGFGNGSLQVGRVDCGSNGNVTVQVAMSGSPLRSGTASITRFC